MTDGATATATAQATALLTNPKALEEFLAERRGDCCAPTVIHHALALHSWDCISCAFNCFGPASRMFLRGVWERMRVPPKYRGAGVTPTRSLVAVVALAEHPHELRKALADPTLVAEMHHVHFFPPEVLTTPAFIAHEALRFANK
jgi:hypothetical protein